MTNKIKMNTTTCQSSFIRLDAFDLNFSVIVMNLSYICKSFVVTIEL